MYPKLLSLLKPFSTLKSATFLGWHAEGPFIDLTKRGAHTPGYLLPAVEGFKSFEEVYGAANLVESGDWAMSDDTQNPAVRLVTAAPEIPGVMDALAELTKRGIAFSIGHRFDILFSLFINVILTFEGSQCCKHRYRHSGCTKWRSTNYPSLQCNAPTSPSRPFDYRFAGCLSLVILALRSLSHSLTMHPRSSTPIRTSLVDAQCWPGYSYWTLFFATNNFVRKTRRIFNTHQTTRNVTERSFFTLQSSDKKA